MSIQVSAVPSSNRKDATSDHLSRPIASFRPSLWGDHFLSHVSDCNISDALVLQQHDNLRKETRNVLMDVMNEPSKNLKLIDAVQRLAVDYHFKNEIEIALNKLYRNFNGDEGDLNATALRFRLLRQHGFHVSSDVFEKFKDEKGNFKESIINDAEGLLSLYEAAHLAIHGENILDQAIAITTTNLQAILRTDHNLKPHLTEQIKHALNRPIRKCLQRLEARHYIDVYSNEESHNSTLLKFAKLDFTFLQRQRQKELYEITKWWKTLDIATRFPYARDRIVELYFWAVGVYVEPHYSLARKILTKIIYVTSILDDTYDSYAIYEELQLLTKAIKRWEIGEINTLPDYMKMLYVILLNTYNEIEEELAKAGQSFCVHYAKEAMKKLVQAYHDEAKWRKEGYVPKIEEYLEISLVSSGYQMLETVSFLGMTNIATKGVFDWISTNPKIARASFIVGRLMNDIVSHKFEQTREHVASAIECYMKQHGAAEEDVVELLREDIRNTWKDINEELLQPNSIPMPILERILNFSRAIDVIYKDDDGYTNSHVLKHLVSSLLNEPLNLTAE